MVSFVHIFSKTYSVKCSSGAKVIGDFSSQCNSNSDVLYIPSNESFKSFKIAIIVYDFMNLTHNSRTPFCISVRQMGISVNSSSNEVWPVYELKWWQYHRVKLKLKHLFQVFQERPRLVHLPKKCAAPKVHHAIHFVPLFGKQNHLNKRIEFNEC